MIAAINWLEMPARLLLYKNKLQVRAKVMRIATFGSCLSRRIAERFIDTHGAEIVSSVYHNRSDFFLETYVDRTRQEPSLGQLQAIVGASGNDAGEFSVSAILTNQCRPTLGLHMLPAGTPFLDLMETGAADLVLVDNYVDAAAQMRRVGDMEFFSTVPAANGIEARPKIKPKQSARNFERLVRLFRKQFPEATICLMGFPFNTYPATSGRKEWASSFDKALNRRGINYIPPVHIPDRYRTKELAHFTPDFYLLYVGQIIQMVAREGEKKHSALGRMKALLSRQKLGRVVASADLNPVCPVVLKGDPVLCVVQREVASSVQTDIACLGQDNITRRVSCAKNEYLTRHSAADRREVVGCCRAFGIDGIL